MMKEGYAKDKNFIWFCLTANSIAILALGIAVLGGQ